MARLPRPTVSEKPSCKMKLVQFHLHKKKKEKKEIIYLRTHREMDRKKSCHIYTKLIVSGTSGGGIKIGRGEGFYSKNVSA